MTSEMSGELLSDGERLAWQSALSMADMLRSLVNGAIAPETGLSSADFLVLTRLRVAPEYRIAGLKALAAKLEWSPSRLSHHLKRMRTRGLVDLVHESDGHLVVSATEAAQRTMERATVLHARAVRRYLLSQVTDAELGVIVQVAARVRGQLSGAVSETADQ
ncbi:ArsR family transcriptional regulator [Streptomyces sp. NPDC094034]|uniref:MarR family winged helix-turn-helix transcriptional regulator n=1 Tax=Streptomyces sp. NPDC094034 TaxID=3155309 RepID=UPI0033203A6D